MIAHGQKVKILHERRMPDYWVGKVGTLLEWNQDNFYTVECEGIHLLLREDEFEVVD